MFKELCTIFDREILSFVSSECEIGASCSAAASARVAHRPFSAAEKDIARLCAGYLEAPVSETRKLQLRAIVCVPAVEGLLADLLHVRTAYEAGKAANAAAAR